MYDYIIVGAGSAGCTLANRLSEDPTAKVLVLEAGKPDKHPFIHMPAGFASMGEKSPYNWRYETEPQAGCNNRRMYWPRGKTLGGSSSINAMLYIRGHAYDYDLWRQLGNEGWAYGDVLPYFKRAENNQRFANDFHGDQGPLGVSNPISPLPICEAYFKAAQEMGIPFNPDFNGANQEGVGYYQLTQKNARRSSAVTAYINPIRDRRNLTIRTGVMTTRVIRGFRNAF